MPASKSKVKLGECPFMDRFVTLTISNPPGSVGHTGKVIDASGNFLCVDIGAAGKPAIPAWFNLAHVVAIVVGDDASEAASVPDPHSPAVSSAQVTDALAAFKARPGPLGDTGD